MRRHRDGDIARRGGEGEPIAEWEFAPDMFRSIIHDNFSIGVGRVMIAAVLVVGFVKAVSELDIVSINQYHAFYESKDDGLIGTYPVEVSKKPRQTTQATEKRDYLHQYEVGDYPGASAAAAVAVVTGARDSNWFG